MSKSFNWSGIFAVLIQTSWPHVEKHRPTTGSPHRCLCLLKLDPCDRLTQVLLNGGWRVAKPVYADFLPLKRVLEKFRVQKQCLSTRQDKLTCFCAHFVGCVAITDNESKLATFLCHKKGRCLQLRLSVTAIAFSVLNLFVLANPSKVFHLTVKFKTATRCFM